MSEDVALNEVVTFVLKKNNGELVVKKKGDVNGNTRRG